MNPPPSDIWSCCDSKSWKLSWSLKRLKGNTLGRFVIFYLRWSGSDVTTLLYLEIKAWGAEGNSRKGARECKEPWEMSRHSASLLLLPHPAFHRQSQFAGQSVSTLARNETTSAPWHIPSPHCRHSLPYSSLLCSHHHRLLADQRPAKEAVKLTWSLFRRLPILLQILTLLF